jgi:hypothetical protein
MKSSHRRGFVHPETGLLFWDTHCIVGERWLEKEVFDAWKEKLRITNKRRYDAKREEILAKSKKFRQENWDRIYQDKVAYCNKNKESIREYKRKWAAQDRAKDRDKHNAKQSAWQSKRNSERIKEDPLFAMKMRLRKATGKAFHRFGYTKRSKTTEILGCSWEEVKAHIESGFTDGMNWENRSMWHIDHIIPLASAKNEDELKKLCHYTNLQPLWGRENIIKGDKLPE